MNVFESACKSHLEDGVPSVLLPTKPKMQSLYVIPRDDQTITVLSTPSNEASTRRW